MDSEEIISPAHHRHHRPHVLIVYKNFCTAASHIGLGVAALNNAKVLNEHGVTATVISANTVKDIEAYLNSDRSITHVVISAPWIPVAELSRLVHQRPRLIFAVNYHSNVAFLRADTRGIELLREYVNLDLGTVNFFMAGNSSRFTTWVKHAFGAPCALLGNMYHLDRGQIHRGARRPRGESGILRIGSFGAPRIQKNMISGAAAALELGQEMHRDVEFWMNSGREDAGVIRTVTALLQGMPGIALRLVPWTSWPQIRRIVRSLDLLISVSSTETFSMVTADGVAEGVPSVTSDAISWVPPSWQVASADDVPEIAKVGERLLESPRAAHEGLLALERSNERAFEGWAKFLEVPRRYDRKYLEE